ncbi:MAG: 30S ribosomal protein S12 methylthiotransferase RimO [Vicinamibacterales bacterium]
MKIGMLSLGCPKNLVDSEVMLGLAQQDGHEITRDAAEADILVVNTCAFIDSAKRESVDAILEMAQHKTAGRCQRLIVTGCLAERYRTELQAEIPEIDVVLGTGEVPDIVQAVRGETARREASGGAPTSDTGAPVALWRRSDAGVVARVAARHRRAVVERELPTYLYDATTPRLLATPGHFAYVKVAEGCDYNCAFCIIPTLRGQYRSRSPESIVTEARALGARGVKELLLISQDTSFYGVDRRERGALARLLAQLDAVEGLEWIRLLYLYPTTVTDEVLDAMASLPKVCRYVDLPLQHSAETMLRRMKRPGHRRQYEALLDRIRRRVPDVTLRTTLIVGFPGESQEEFDDLHAFVRAVEFDHLGVFTYSHEEGTSAHRLDDDVPAAEKLRRRRVLMQTQKRIVARRHRRRIGAQVRLLVDGPSDGHEFVLQGRLEGQAPDIDPVVYLTECDPTAVPPGSFVEAEIVQASGYDLVARPL